MTTKAPSEHLQKLIFLQYTLQRYYST